MTDVSEGLEAADARSALEALEAIARGAGAVILQIYDSNFAVRGKADASPVTEADEAAERLIVPALQGLQVFGSPWPVVAEEAASRGDFGGHGGFSGGADAATAHGTADAFWLVDPLDGTREFVSRNGEFTVNIALVRNGLPVLGVVFVPVQDRLYLGAVGHGAWLVDKGRRRAIACRSAPVSGATLACSRSHGDAAAMASWLQSQPALPPIASHLAVGSSLKFGLIASGDADIYPRLGRTMEWDTAAGHAVLLAAGGSVCTLAGGPLRYGKPGYENPHFVARGRA